MKFDFKKLGGDVLDVAKGSARIAKDKIQEGAEKVKEVDWQEKGKELQGKTKELQGKAKELIERYEINEEDAAIYEGIERSKRPLSSETALLAVFYLMAIDGEIRADEEEKLVEVGKELDPSFDQHRAAIHDVCRTEFDSSMEPEKLYQFIESSVEKLLEEDVPSKDSLVTPKLLVWDMMAVAYSDGEYAGYERKLVEFVARKLEIDEAILLELESSLETMIALDKEEKWIKTTNRPYLEIEEHVNEIADRKNVIFNSIKDLITL